MNFKSEYNRINSVNISDDEILAKDNHRYGIIGHIYEEAEQYFEFILNYFKQKKIQFIEIGLGKLGNFVLTGNLLKMISCEVKGVGIEDLSYSIHKHFDVRKVISLLQPNFQNILILDDSQKEATRDLAGYHCSVVDLLYIDGDHSYKGVKKDFELYSPLVRKDGLIIFHDIKNENEQVRKFWKEIKNPHCKEFVKKDKTRGCHVGIGIYVQT